MSQPIPTIPCEHLGNNWYHHDVDIMCDLCRGFHGINYLPSRTGVICRTCAIDITYGIGHIPARAN